MKRKTTKLQYAIKLNGQPVVKDRAYIAALLKETCIVRRGKMSDGTRVFATANGNIVYIQYQTLRQRRYWAAQG